MSTETKNIARHTVVRQRRYTISKRLTETNDYTWNSQLKKLG